MGELSRFFKQIINERRKILVNHKVAVEWDRYKAAVSWTEVGIVEVEGTSVENAIENAEKRIDDLILPEGEYLDESFRIDEDTTKILNKIEKGD